MKKHFVARVVVGHRITIPAEVCEVLEIENGDLVDIDLMLARKIKTLERRSKSAQNLLKIKPNEMRNRSR